ncbi:MAG: choice-of-anchor D domain-containing protein, partial [Cyclobacteriaceae bacterium]
MKRILLSYLLGMLSTVVYSQAFTEGFTSAVISCEPSCNTFSFTQGGIQYNVTYTGTDGMEDEGFDDVLINANSPVNASVSIVRNDGNNFLFTSIEIINSLAAADDVTVGGYLSSSLVGSAQDIPAGNSGTTFSFSDIIVDEVRITSDLNRFALTTFSGNNTAPASNATPVVTAPSTPTSVAEDATNVALNNDVDVSDADAGDTQTVRIQVSNGTVTTGTLGITFGGTDGANGNADFTIQGTLTAVNAALDVATFTPTSDFSGAASISLTSNDGTIDSNTDVLNITVTAVNDAPVVTAPGAAYTVDEQTNLDIHGTGFGVTDVDEAGSGANATISVPISTGIITVVAGSSGVSVDGGSGTNSVDISGTIAQINALLTSAGGGAGTIVYNANLDDPPSSTTITVTVNDEGNTGTDPLLTGDGSSEEGTNNQTINITGLNDEPTLSLTRAGAGSVSFGAGGSSVSLYSAAAISTVESGQDITGIVIDITDVDDGTSEELTIDGEAIPLTDATSNTTTANVFGWAVAFTGADATVTITGNRAASLYQDLIDGLQYENTAAVPNTANTRVITLSDLEDDGSNTGSNDNINDLSGVTTAVTITISTEPEMDIDHNAGANALADGGSFDFGDLGIGSTLDTTFTIENNGSTDLTLTTAVTPVAIAGGQFTIQGAQPSSPISAGGSETFTVRFTPTGGAAAGTISIANDDSDENPYNFTLAGNGTTTVSTIVRADANNTNAASVDWTVTFAHAVSNLTAANFSLATPTGNLTGYSLTAFADGGSSPSTTWTVTASGGTSGTGDLRLDLDKGTMGSLSPQVSNTLNGEVYSLDLDAPSAPSAPNMTAASDLGPSSTDNLTSDAT